MRIVERKLETKIKEFAKYFPVVSVTGPRQSGKSTLVQKAFPSYNYVTFDDQNIRMNALNDPIGFIQSIKKPLIIDEAQYAPEIFNVIKMYVDRQDKPGQVILTGSQNFLLSKKINESLAGRVGILKLLPFSYAELKNTKEKLNVDNFIFDGGYPRKHKDNIPNDYFYSSYIETYLERDVEGYLDVRNIDVFKKFIRLLAQNCGQLLNYSKFARDLQANIQTIKNWVSILESSYIIKLIYPYSKNIRKTIIKSPKIYFLDTGLLCNLLNIKNVNDMLMHDMFGNIFENFVFFEKLKSSLNKAERNNLYYYRDTSRIEIDMIDDSEPDIINAYEIKSGMTFQNKFLRTLFKSGELLNNDRVFNHVIFRGDYSFVHSSIFICGIEDWLLEINN